VCLSNAGSLLLKINEYTEYVSNSAVSYIPEFGDALYRSWWRRTIPSVTADEDAPQDFRICDRTGVLHQDFSGFSIFKIKTCARAPDSFEDVQRMENKILYQAVVFSDLTSAASQKKY